jgi:hypothetical protein
LTSEQRRKDAVSIEISRPRVGDADVVDVTLDVTVESKEVVMDGLVVLVEEEDEDVREVDIERGLVALDGVVVTEDVPAH